MKKAGIKQIFWSLLGLFPLTGFASAGATTEQQIQCLQQSYAPYIRSVQLTPRIEFIMTNGESILWNDKKQKSFEQKMAESDLKDTFSIDYPAFTPVNNAPLKNEDPGRFRNYIFLGAVYGDSKEAVEKNLVMVDWLPYATVKKVPFNKQNGAAAALKEVVEELNTLPKKYRPYLKELGGTFNYREIAGTKLLSAHSYGISIDINTQYSNYWRGHLPNLQGQPILFKNKIPQEIVNIFERHGFIWGGRWYHYDTMHFEYRPEFFCKLPSQQPKK